MKTYVAEFEKHRQEKEIDTYNNALKWFGMIVGENLAVGRFKNGEYVTLYQEGSECVTLTLKEYNF